MIILKQNGRILVSKPKPTGQIFFFVLAIVRFSRQKGNPLKLEGYPFLSLGAKNDNPLKVDQLLFSHSHLAVLRSKYNLLLVWCWIFFPNRHTGDLRAGLDDALSA